MSLNSLCLLFLKSNQWLDDVIFFCLHHVKCPLDLGEREPMCR